MGERKNMVIPLDCNYGLAHIYKHEHGAAGSGPNRPPLFNNSICPSVRRG